MPDKAFQRWRHAFRQPLQRGDCRRWRRILAIGLHLLIASLLCALFLMNYYQQKQQRLLPFLPAAGLLLLTIGINILANLCRTVSLVVLLILPGNPLRGIFGLLLIGIDVLVPLLPMIRFAIHRFGHPVLPANGSPAIRSRWVLAGNLLAAAVLLTTIAMALFNHG